MTGFENFKTDLLWIQSRLCSNVSVEEIEAALNLLEKSGMLKKEDGKYVPVQSLRSTSPFDFNDHRRYLDGVLKAANILQHDFDKHRPGSFFNAALSVTEEEYKEIVKLMVQFTDEVKARSERAKSSDRVVYMTSSLFHVAKQTPISALESKN